MKSHALCLTVLVTVAISIATRLPAQAQRARTFVSITGNDANPCTAGSPCKTFQRAHDTVLAGGEISVLDTGGYGTLVINKAISIVAIGIEASIAIPSGGTGITINAGPSDRISLRGLTLDGGNPSLGTSGIVFNSGLSLKVADCSVSNMGLQGYGLQFLSNAKTVQKLAVSNSHFYDSAEGIMIGVLSSGSVLAAVDRTEFSNDGVGLNVDGSNGTGALTVAVADSVVAASVSGVTVNTGTSSGIANVSLTRVLLEGNETGIEVFGAQSALWLGQSTLTGNMSEFSVQNGSINSYGDNYAAANPTANGSLGTATKQ